MAAARDLGRGESALIAGAALIALAAAVVRAVAILDAPLPAAPILDPLEARELQLAAILAGQGFAAFAAALAPGDIGAVGGVLPVALVGWLAGGFDDLALLRLPAFIALVLAGWAAYGAVFRLTGRALPAALAAATLFATPATGLLALSSTADSMTLLLLVAVTGAMGRLLRWGGDGWLDHPADCAEQDVLYDPPGDRRADLFLIDPPGPEGHGPAIVFWGGLGLSTWVAGAAVAMFAAAAVLASVILFGSGLVRRHPGLPRWRPGPFRPLPGLALALALAAMPQVAVALAAGEWDIARLAGLLRPRPEAGLYPAAPLGWWLSLALLLWPALALLPMAWFSRLNWGPARETFVVVFVLGWVPYWALFGGGQGLALVWGILAAALVAGYLANYGAETRRRGHIHLEVLFGPQAAWFAATALGGAGAVAAVVTLFTLSGGGDYTVVALLLGVILLTFPVAWAAIERSIGGFLLALLAIGTVTEFTAAALMLPRAGATWPDWRVAAVLGPFRSCGAGTIVDETGFDPGFLHHAGPGAAGPGSATAGRAAMLIRAGDDAPPGWRRAGSLSWQPPWDSATRVHVFVNPAAGPGAGLHTVRGTIGGSRLDPSASWRSCLGLLAPEDARR